MVMHLGDIILHRFILQKPLKIFVFTNYLAYFNRTWRETCLGDGDSEDFSKEGTGSCWGPIRGKIRENLIYFIKSSSHEPMTIMH